MSELLRCPFCGGEAYYSYVGDGEWVVRCFECKAEVRIFMAFKYTSDEMKKGREKVIEAWNRRTKDEA